MCGRFCIAASPGELSERYRVQIPDTYIPRYNLAPAEPMLFISKGDDSLLAEMGTFGFMNGLKTRIINARSETVLEKPLFRKINETGRCLIPVSGYYEWHHISGQKIPYYFFLPSYPILTFAGLMRDTGDVKEVVILTTASEGKVKIIHPRMPFIIPKEAENDYLAGCDPEKMCKIPPSDILIHRVSEKINTPGIDGPDLIRPVSNHISNQTTLF